MVEPSERRFVYSLRREECIDLLNDLELDTTGAVSTLRVKITSAAKKADADEVEVFKEHKKRYDQRKDYETFRKYASQLPFPECQDVLVDFKKDVQGSEESLREVLVEALNETTGEERLGWIEIATEYVPEPQINENRNLISSTKVKNTRCANSSEKTASSAEGENDDSGSESDEEEAPPRLCRKTARSFKNSLPKMARIMEQVQKWKLSFKGGDPEAA